MIKRYSIIYLTILSFFFLNTGCNKLLDASLPNDAIAGDEVFTNDNTALSAVSGIYSNMIIGSDPFYLANGVGLSAMGGLCADEMYDFAQTYADYTTNRIVFTSNNAVYYMWKSAYTYIYSANAAIIGMEAPSSKVTAATKQQLLGEVYFIRAFCYFYLVNLYGDVPLLTSTDYTTNATQPRTAAATVYNQIIADLQKAESLLTAAYPSGEKVRPNKNVASALLARVYLYNKQWAAAEAKATEVMQGAYNLEPAVNNVFLKGSAETIWQLKPANTTGVNTWEGRLFTPTTAPTFVLRDSLLNNFEAGDKRKAAWIGAFTYQSAVYNYPAKYKSYQANVASTEYSIVFRLAEQYLLRAEARAEQSNLTGAIQDVDSIRNRAGLPLLSVTNPGINQTDLLAAIARENRLEFFAEYGHRWFDLKRTDKADEVLSALKPATWKSYAQLWPVPQQEINANTNLKQNIGYQP
ncbi:RagB/SusD domain-containing protein [Chitinophaga sp. CF118]|uniref:RagB/SusD family nutrient uptake outer membrane protein n=1 Tax=Chitinophaga sp. CF118 TaxID=1884367 RepID=UPI0008DF11B6|nr:RagB/SusD family nutrient uptake outer membrane protein [Chitinophaga sp. CF118]SFE40842.1 RagB/SusD domain-containing protein [Chitinophaga sp. CF118]